MKPCATPSMLRASIKLSNKIKEHPQYMECTIVFVLIISFDIITHWFSHFHVAVELSRRQIYAVKTKNDSTCTTK